MPKDPLNPTHWTFKRQWKSCFQHNLSNNCINKTEASQSLQSELLCSQIHHKFTKPHLRQQADPNDMWPLGIRNAPIRVEETHMEREGKTRRCDQRAKKDTGGLSGFKAESSIPPSWGETNRKFDQDHEIIRDRISNDQSEMIYLDDTDVGGWSRWIQTIRRSHEPSILSFVRMCVCVFSHFIILLFILHIQDAGVLFRHRTAALSAAVRTRPHRRRLLPASSANQSPGLRGDGAVQWALQLGLKRRNKGQTQTLAAGPFSPLTCFVCFYSRFFSYISQNAFQTCCI